jgi:hypothetical protein
VTITSSEEFVRLRLSDDPADYRRASNEDAPMEVWEAVIATRPDMKPWVIHNKTVPLEMLRGLASDADTEVRCAVAGKRKLDRELFNALAADPEPEVRHRVAWNAKVPVDLLLALTRDENAWVAAAAHHRLEVLPERKRRRLPDGHHVGAKPTRDAVRAAEPPEPAEQATTEHTIGFDECVAHLLSLVGENVSVTVLGTDPEGEGVVAEIIGVLRRRGADRDASACDKPLPEAFGFVDRADAVYLDPDAFVEGWVWDSYLRITTTFGTIVIAGPIERPDWF